VCICQTHSSPGTLALHLVPIDHCVGDWKRLFRLCSLCRKWATSDAGAVVYTVLLLCNCLQIQSVTQRYFLWPQQFIGVLAWQVHRFLWFSSLEHEGFHLGGEEVFFNANWQNVYSITQVMRPVLEAETTHFHCTACVNAWSFISMPSVRLQELLICSLFNEAVSASQTVWRRIEG